MSVRRRDRPSRHRAGNANVPEHLDISCMEALSSRFRGRGYRDRYETDLVCLELDSGNWPL